MHSKTAYNHYRKARQQLLNCISPYKTHSQILECRDEIMKWNNIAKCPNWVKEKLEEAFHTKTELMYRYELKWCCLEWNGVRYNDWDSIPEEGKDLLRYGKREEYEHLQYHYWEKTGIKY
jgi:hypothetical protein